MGERSSWLDRNRSQLDDQQLTRAHELVGGEVEFTIPAVRGFPALDWAGFPSLIQRQRVLAFTPDTVFVLGGRMGAGVITRLVQRSPRSSFMVRRLTRTYGRVEVDGVALFVHRRWFDAVNRGDRSRT